MFDENEEEMIAKAENPTSCQTCLTNAQVAYGVCVAAAADDASKQKCMTKYGEAKTACYATGPCKP